ncbi:UV radiation resistance protein [Helicobacter pylori]|uniref:UV radiation resistance protein n=1 Tax=Helicobacter pylori TaxID=210 RepID=UPI00192066F0|nr:UV radiation resistance protein [Helicobacter pylori]QQW78795.1 UV radiation resistance protein [Helicobacter pylori]
MSWIDIGVSPGSSVEGSGSNLLRGFIQSLGNSLNNAHYSGSIRGFPRQLNHENDQIVGYYDDPNGYYAVIRKFLAEKNYHSNERLKNAFERLTNIQNRLHHLNQEISAKQNAINNLNNDLHRLNQEISTKQNQALNYLNQEIASLNNEISTLKNAIQQEEDKLNALELQTESSENKNENLKESLKELEKLKQELQRLKKQSKWKKSFNFLTDNPPNIQAKQQQALQASQKKRAYKIFLTYPYAILPKGFIYEYHNPGKETYNALNAPNNMDGINNNFRVNALNQVLDNSYQKFLPGNDSYNALGDIEQVKALKFYDLVLNYNLESENKQSALFFKQISQYAKGLRLKILTAKSTKKGSQRIEELEKTINQEEERLKGKDLNSLQQEIQKEQENALKLKESIKAKQSHIETLKNALSKKENAKNPIEQQKQTIENQINEKEQQKQTLERQKNEKEHERQNLNNEINAIGNERVTIKELGTKDNTFGVLPFLNYNGRTYARAEFSDKNKSIREYYEIETKIKNILGFYRIGESDDRILQRFLQLSHEQQNELARLILA